MIKVRWLLFFSSSSLTGEYVNAVFLFHPASHPPSLLSPSQHTCAVSFPSFYFFPHSVLISPIHTQHINWPALLNRVCSHEILGRKRMTEADVHFFDRGNFGIMCCQLLSLSYCLMELHCLAGSHATGRDLILLKQTYRTPCLIEMFPFTQ